MHVIDMVATELMELFSALMDASLEQSFGGIGGCKHFELESYPARFRSYITRYLEMDESDSAKIAAEYLYDNGYLNESVGSKVRKRDHVSD